MTDSRAKGWRRLSHKTFGQSHYGVFNRRGQVCPGGDGASEFAAVRKFLDPIARRDVARAWRLCERVGFRVVQVLMPSETT